MKVKQARIEIKPDVHKLKRAVNRLDPTYSYPKAVRDGLQNRAVELGIAEEFEVIK